MAAPDRAIELGVFLPVAEGGFIFSEHAPPTPATWAHNRDVALLAEELGFDFVMSQSKWRGFGGPTRAWDVALESHTLMTLLAVATRRIRLIASVNILSIHPGVLAKMVATAAEASNGRYGLNIVTGSFPSEMAQFGLWHSDHDRRYDLADEYVHMLQRLWTEDSVTHDGDFFTLKDAQSWPKPDRPVDIVCAGASDKGLDFTARRGTAAFVSASGGALHKVEALSRKAKAVAQEHGRTIRTYTTMMLVPGATVDEAEERRRHILAGADEVALGRMAEEYGIRTAEDDQGGGAERLRARAMMGPPVAGPADFVADQIARTCSDGDLDGVMLEMPDYIEDQRWFGREVLPILRERGLVRG